MGDSLDGEVRQTPGMIVAIVARVLHIIILPCEREIVGSKED